MIKNILFDMDDVLCAYNFQDRLDIIADATGVSAVVIEDLIFTSGFEDTADTGIFTTDQYLAEIAERLGTPIDRDMFIRARAETTIPDPEMIQLVSTLQKTHELAALTNNGWFMADNAHLIVPEIKDLFGDRFFVSAQVGASKLSTDSFNTLIPRLGWQKDETLFVDDFTPYIAKATEAGVRTHQFTTVDSLKTDLRRHGILD
ncbi:MAG: hypothetical protein HN644_04880 [Rhodospirillales bacterium]|jgi:glucose-1-phosphatase|nr:hypothetical protein [Rhodospirillales bacterium]MBT4041329.1 hypothetical protein [Rhodospirillales bacterium]MBT4626976.1 hypothetical protein [Rhodospirillales bacterium]MBT5352206.1 hypothetical protein [Rhodospirillales bacterium]MBT5520557.1 hypothetical protein [Rhodospirillales bacterium]